VASLIIKDTVRGNGNDPLSLNLYTYCLNNPIKYDDPTGHITRITSSQDAINLVNELNAVKAISATTKVTSSDQAAQVAKVQSTKIDAVLTNYSQPTQAQQVKLVEDAAKKKAAADAEAKKKAAVIVKNTNVPDAKATGNSTSWLDSTKPLIPFKIPSTGDLVNNFISSSAGSATGTIGSNLDKIKKPLPATLNENGYYQPVSAGSIQTYSPFTKAANVSSKIGDGLAIGTTALDVGNTWSTDDGNTNVKRLEKTSIQLRGAITAFGAGYCTAEICGAAILLAPETGGLSLLAIPVVVIVDYGISTYIGNTQNKLYKKYNIN
jgi:hypothetical protein